MSEPRIHKRNVAMHANNVSGVADSDERKVDFGDINRRFMS